MLNKDQINSEIELVATLKLLSQSYEEISVLRIQKVKTSVLATRDFLDRLAQVYADVRTNYKYAIEKIEQRHKRASNMMSFNTSVKNGREVTVFISANSKFYGGVINKVFQAFRDYVSSHNTDLVIIGKVGRELMSGSSISNKPYEYFEVPDMNIDITHLRGVMQHITQYEKVNVFYPKFTNMVTQDAAVAHLSGETVSKDAVKAGPKEYTKYFFEPSLEVIVAFFEKQVLTSDFKQTVQEGELARLAGRIRAMEEMLSNIEDRQKELRAESLKYKKYIDNKRRIESLAGMFLWTKK